MKKSGAFFLLLLLVGCAGPGLERYKNFVHADVPVAPESGVRVTYLGVNGYLLQSSDATVLVDPYFSRIPLGAYLTSHHLEPDMERVAWGMRHLPMRVDLILVTHAHPDHLFDAADIAVQKGAI